MKKNISKRIYTAIYDKHGNHQVYTLTKKDLYKLCYRVSLFDEDGFVIDHELEEEIKNVLTELGLSVIEFLSARRKRILVYARVAISVVLFNRGLNADQACHYVNKDRTSVLWYLKSHEIKMNYNDYRELYIRIKELMK